MSDHEDGTAPAYPGEEITLGQRTYTLEAPCSLTLAIELLELGQQSIQRATAAALLVCSSKLRRATKLSTDRFPSASALGLAAFDELAARHAPVPDIYTAGMRAYMLCATVVRGLGDGGEAEEGNSVAAPSSSS